MKSGDLGVKKPFTFNGLRGGLNVPYCGLKNMNILKQRYFIDKATIDHIKSLYPNQLPLDRGTTPEDIAYLQGQQSVIAKLEVLFNENLED